MNAPAFGLAALGGARVTGIVHEAAIRGEAGGGLIRAAQQARACSGGDRCRARLERVKQSQTAGR
jgi:hypothetical protein